MKYKYHRWKSKKNMLKIYLSKVDEYFCGACKWQDRCEYFDNCVPCYVERPCEELTGHRLSGKFNITFKEAMKLADAGQLKFELNNMTGGKE